MSGTEALTTAVHSIRCIREMGWKPELPEQVHSHHRQVTLLLQTSVFPSLKWEKQYLLQGLLQKLNEILYTKDFCV